MLQEMDGFAGMDVGALRMIPPVSFRTSPCVEKAVSRNAAAFSIFLWIEPASYPFLGHSGMVAQVFQPANHAFNVEDRGREVRTWKERTFHSGWASQPGWHVGS